jgi:peroxiredoxin
VQLRPLVIVFIKDGCPCSVEFEPIYNRLHTAYRESVDFAGVIDSDEIAAGRFAEQSRSPYPLLSDPRCETIRRFQVESGAYVALLNAD